MVCGMGVLVIAPDGFAYPKSTAMGELRHKDLQPLKRAGDNVDYWANDLLYASSSEGKYTYSTTADGVLGDPEGYRELYQLCFELRHSELHFIIERLPLWVKTHGFFLGGTSEGGMTIARFDDQRYGKMVRGRFINSFSVEYCYFTPTPEAGLVGGQLEVPTVNIIGTKDEYFGAEDSVAKIVAENKVTGYGDGDLTGNAYRTFVRQGVQCGLVCVLEDGVHSPCKTHDNFLRQLFDTFFSRPASICELDNIWKVDPTLRGIKRTTAGDSSQFCNVLQVFVPRMRFPQTLPIQKVEILRHVAHAHAKLKARLEEEARSVAADLEGVKAMLNQVRAKSKHGRPLRPVVAGAASRTHAPRRATTCTTRRRLCTTTSSTARPFGHNAVAAAHKL